MNESILCKHLCASISVVTRPDGIVMLDTPFCFPDGDHYPIYLEETGADGIRISDGGHTLMHLGYENDIDKLFESPRGPLLSQILAEERIKYDEKKGAFYIETTMEYAIDAAFRLVQAITRVCALRDSLR